MERKGIERFAPLTGVVFLVLAAGSFIISGEPAGVDDSAAEHVEFWGEDEGKQIASAVMATWAAFMLVWFAASVRQAIARVEPDARLASIAFAGAVITATGIAVSSAVQFALAETAGDVPPEVTQTMGILYSDIFFPMALGFALFMLGAGLAAVRHGAFDKRLGWIAIVIGAICITPLGFFGFIASLIWIGIAGVVLYRKTDPVGSGAAPPPGPETPAAPA